MNDNDLKLPPHSVESEQGILGCILIDGKGSIDACMEIFNGNSDVFYDARHRVIFDTCKGLASEGCPIDLISVQSRLSASHELESIGGIGYLATLPDMVPSAANLPHYALEAYDKFVLREVISRCTKAIQRAFRGHQTTSETLDELETDVLGIRQLSAANEKMKTMKELVKSAIDTIESYHQNQGKLMGLGTSLDNIDKFTNGLRDGEMIVIAARPSVGKTALAMQIVAHNALETRIEVGVFSLEMSALSLAVRELCSHAKVNGRNVTRGGLNGEDMKNLTLSAVALSRAGIHIDDSVGLTIETLRAKARRMHQRFGIRLLVIDYIQLMRGSGKSQNREGEIAEISRGIKCLAKELRIPIVALSQLNREMEKTGRKPNLSDLRESGAIEQDADLVGMLYRPVRGKDEKPIRPGDMVPTNLLIAKQRNGPTGDAKLMFQPEHTRFHDVSQIDESDVPSNLPYND